MTEEQFFKLETAFDYILFDSSIISKEEAEYKLKHNDNIADFALEVDDTLRYLNENRELKQLLEEIKGKIKCADGLFAFDPKFYFGQIGTYEVFDYDISELNFKDLIKQIDEVLEDD